MQLVPLISHNRFVEVDFPIEENPKEIINLIIGLPIMIILIDVYLSSSPFRYLRIVLSFGDGEDMFTEERNAKVSVGTEELSKDLLDFFAFVVEK